MKAKTEVNSAYRNTSRMRLGGPQRVNTPRQLILWKTSVGGVSRERFEEILDEGIEGGILLAVALDFSD